VHISGIRHHVLKDVTAEALDGYRLGASWKSLRNDPVLRENWISFTSLEWDAASESLVVGLTSFDSDILWRFSPGGSTFESLGFPKAARDQQFVKIHRGITPDRKGGFYFGTAGLPDLDERNDAPGGVIVHYVGGQFSISGKPIPHDYIQNIQVDLQRDRAYGVTYPVMWFFDYDLKKSSTLFSFFTGSHFHETGLDDEGGIWGTWSARQGHCLFRYRPDGRSVEFFSQPIPNLDPEHVFNFPMNGPIDAFTNGGDGYLYFGTTLGELYRLNSRTGEASLLGKPTDGIRLSGLQPGPKNTLLGSYGAYGETGLFLYDLTLGRFVNLGSLRDADLRCFLVHDIAWDGRTRVFAAETDNPDRSGYLWEATIAWD
jgi:hypothetical protein